jgi:hypothetical protein
MNVSATGKFAPGGFPVNGLMNTKKTHGVIPDASSAL